MGVRAQTAAPNAFSSEEVTGQYEGVELQSMRAKRPTIARVARIEDKMDAHGDRLGKVEVELAKVSGQMDGQDKVLANIDKSLANMSAREHVTFTAQVDVGKAQAIDIVDSRKTRREWVTQALKIAAAVIGVAITAFTAGRC